MSKKQMFIQAMILMVAFVAGLMVYDYIQKKKAEKAALSTPTVVVTDEGA